MLILFSGWGCSQVSQQSGSSNSAPNNPQISLSASRVILAESPASSLIQVSAAADDSDDDLLTYAWTVSSGNITDAKNLVNSHYGLTL